MHNMSPRTISNDPRTVYKNRNNIITLPKTASLNRPPSSAEVKECVEL
jgi:hypothetical protein